MTQYHEDPLHAEGDEQTRAGPEGPGNLPSRRLPWGVVSIIAVVAGFLIAFTALNHESPTAKGPEAVYDANRPTQTQ
ncbi:hypothetical protein [Asticcacaulis sp. YBE204]|uniref:hypothetical protein n=1 Tax=Asticcacaulis sp. YBE204 TaxID=1282363 RepID=UPI0003C3FB72|nr:hypothetical protein [Asticcacaulis sp. YBE204]ESQ79621.1 hypothetical protein AEYBE204_07200 [Asticcacaulis sp. YBE204]